jgi:CHAT domain-containing protein
VLTGSEASAQAVADRIETAGLFHFSGHGFAAAGLGGLYLAGAPLTSAWFQKMRLDACRLVVLSACLTAMGQGDGLTNPDSLVHSILDAGAGSVIASRWRVDSAATAALMSSFYSSIFRMRDPALALQCARESVRANHKFAHPYFWAAFQVYE